MTGTAATEAEEFKQIYDIDVVVVPTNEPVIRADYPDAVYKTTRAKYGAIVKEISQLYEKGQPVLIGTRSIEHNQIISNYLKRKKITHNVLNAKNHEQEALIIADAGKSKAVTVATNIAGRGVDIVLGGAMPEDKSDHQALKDWQAKHSEVIKLGGLHIIGSERHESRRIDNQLRGRSGRQGDPGSSRFYVALEDDIMRLFGGEQVARLMDMLKIPEDQPIEHSMVSKAIEQAQTKVEGFYFDQRKRVLEFDDVMNKQREIIYKRRYQILQDSENLESTKLKDRILDLVNREIGHLVIARTPEGLTSEEYDAIIKEFITIIPFDTDSQQRLKKQIAKISASEDIIAFLNQIARDTYQQREQKIGSQLAREIEKFALLSAIDSLWMDHLDSMDDLREGIWLRGGKEQVLSEYKKEAFEMFENLMASIDTEVAKRVFRIQIGEAKETTLPEQVIEEKKDILAPTPATKPEPRRQTTGDFASALAASSKKSPKPEKGHYLKPVVSGQPKVGRNDPCPCGAINPKTKKPYKYKKCGLINAPYHQG
jgi:preprotein translocase subunit SecA